jgi:hypothetical protein
VKRAFTEVLRGWLLKAMNDVKEAGYAKTAGMKTNTTGTI